MRYHSVILLAVLLTPMLLYGQEEREEMQFLVIEALSNNPDISAELHRMELMRQRIPQAGALDDPQLTYKIMEFPGVNAGQAVYQNVELMQMITFPTKLSTRKQIAALRTEHAHHDHLERVLEVIAQLKEAHAMLWSARTSLAINQEHQRMLGQILRSAETLYSVGKGSQQEVLKTSIELAKLQVQEAAIRREIESAESMLRALLNRPQTSSVGPVSVGRFSPIEQTLDALLAFSRRNRPMLNHDSLGVEEGKFMLSMAKQEYLPDFRLSLERVFMPQMGIRSWSVMAGISIPFSPWTLSKASARVQEANAERLMREAMFRSSLNMVEARIRARYARVKSLEVTVRSFEESIVPQTSQSVQSLLAEYQTGRTSYLMLLDGFRMYEEMRMEATMARMEFERERAKLERECGVIDLNVIPRVVKENDQ